MSKTTKTKQIPFKKGEKVICVNSQVIEYYLGELQEGEIYTVEKYDIETAGVYLSEIKMYNGFPFNAARFKKVKSPNNYPVVSDNEFMVKEIQVTYKKKNIIPLRIQGSLSVANFLRSIWNKNTFGLTEQFVVICLDNGNKILGYKVISEGGVTGTVVDVKCILGIALKTFATSIIISHNHPSGTLSPSNGDVSITSKITAAAKNFDIKVLDHIILTENSYYSFADANIPLC